MSSLKCGPAELAMLKPQNTMIEHVEEFLQDDDEAQLHVTHSQPNKNSQSESNSSSAVAITAQSSTKRSRIHLLDLPIEILELLCTDYLDTVTCTCFGLACKAFFEITEHLYPWQVNLHMRSRDKKCLGHLLTDWMAPKYSFDHAWGKFLLKKHYLSDEKEIERQWKKKESWRRIRIVVDKFGAAVAYESTRKGF
ncbi:uncharacterized protein LY89DRAFT_683592 [Mollisia scopiformis]|uniref:Uncharacterized protein n=1 Tax=Mollisia scopiformis TaxID=149040 RepID=A0A194XFY7_MOLSC|nr:uncharacterized protein LY89DRAFT_683592 [Mollisia scopiformis]KUJ18687.1 hypothetical protein LY89DRAFT_683592 [Mollisia scopiformis]